MTILCDTDLHAMLRDGLVQDPDHGLVNPASIDIRIGAWVLIEAAHGRMDKIKIPDDGLRVEPNDFLLTETLEHFNVPNGYAMELRLKSTSARQGWNHAMAVWIDPGFKGVITLEIKNDLQYNTLRLLPRMRFAQAIVHRLSGPSSRPYSGKYQNAFEVEGAKA